MREGMIEFRDTLTGLIDEYGQIEEDQFELPKPHVIGDKRNKQVPNVVFSNELFKNIFHILCIHQRGELFEMSFLVFP